MPKAKLRTQAVCESSSSQESLSTPSVKDNLRSRIEQKLVQQNEERFSKSQDNATLWNSLFYSSQCHIGHVSATRENEAGVDLCYISVSAFGEIRTWAVKLFDFHGKRMVLAEISLIFMVKKAVQGKQCAAFSCSKTFYGPNGLPTSFHFFKLMHGGMYFC